MRGIDEGESDVNTRVGTGDRATSGSAASGGESGFFRSPDCPSDGRSSPRRRFGGRKRNGEVPAGKWSCLDGSLSFDGRTIGFGRKR